MTFAIQQWRTWRIEEWGLRKILLVTNGFSSLCRHSCVGCMSLSAGWCPYNRAMSPKRIYIQQVMIVSRIRAVRWLTKWIDTFYILFWNKLRFLSHLHFLFSNTEILKHSINFPVLSTGCSFGHKTNHRCTIYIYQMYFNLEFVTRLI